MAPARRSVRRRHAEEVLKESRQGVFLRRVELRAGAPDEGYPYGLPAVRGLESVTFDQVTFLVGDNGAGKSTITEAIAVASGFSAEGGSRNLHFATFDTHSSLGDDLHLIWNSRPRWGWFSRAETFYGMASHIVGDDDTQSGLAPMFGHLHEESHGESFLEIALGRFDTEGFYALDEPESALSGQGQLTLLRLIHDSCRTGSQFIIATHSPILMAFPGARIIHLDQDGPRRLPYDQVPAVQLWKRFFDDPASILRHLLDDDDLAADPNR